MSTTPQDTRRSARGITRRSALASACMLAAPAAFAQAAEYPKPGSTLRYVVPFPAGGVTDVMARLVAQQLGARWKVNVLVDNKPGAAALIGADFVAKAPPDGNTLLAITMTHSANATLYRGKAPFDFDKDLKPVALLAGSPILVVVPASSNVRSLKDLVTAAKSAPLSAGSSGNGTPSHLSLAMFNQLNGTSIQHIPYKGGTPSIADLIGGQVQVIFSNFPESIAHVKSGKLRAIAIASAKRHLQVPDVPTTAEAGMPKLLVEQWTAVMLPGTAPDTIVQRLGDELVHIMQAPDVAEKAAALGFRVDPRGPREFTQFYRSEVQRWRAVIEAGGIRPE